MQRQLETTGGEFGIIEAGPADGPLVLLLHGFPDDATSFTGLQAALTAAGRRSVAVYLRGYAPSPLDGEFGIVDMARDLFAVHDALGGLPCDIVGHDIGSQITYAAISQAPRRFRRAVTLAGAHPTIIAGNLKRLPRQWWMSRYIVGMQLPGAVAQLARNDFAQVDALWRRWAAKGWPLPVEHLRRVKATLAASLPGPVTMYRKGSFDIGDAPVSVPTLFIAGAVDGCLDPRLSDRQERLFKAEYRREVVTGAGHWPHLEQPELVESMIVEWLSRS